MSSEDTKILKFNQYQKSGKVSYIIYADLQCLIKKIDGCKGNSENSFIGKIGKHIPSGFSISKTSSFKNIENMHDICRGKDCMKKYLTKQIFKRLINKGTAGIIWKCKNLLNPSR